MLPPLHRLSIGGVADQPAVLANPRRKWRRAGRRFIIIDDSEDDDSEGPREEISKESYHPIDSPFVHEITQEQAARWYEEGDYLGAGVMGETHKYKVPESELPGGPWVMIKNFKRKLYAAKDEVELHLRVWQGSGGNDCRKYLAAPAHMQFPDTEEPSSHEGPIFTVQALVHGEDVGVLTDTQDFDDASEQHLRVLWNLPPSAKEAIARQYGDMMGCFAKAGLVHGDLHGGNVLVTHNLNALEGVDRAVMTSRLHFQFHTIDWGFASTINPESYDANGVPKSVCLHLDHMNLGTFGNRKDKYQRTWRQMFGIDNYFGDLRGEVKSCLGESWHGVYLLMRSLFQPNNWQEELPDDGKTTRAQILDWVRLAYLECLGVEYPPEERKAMDALLWEERTKPMAERTLQAAA